MTFSTDIVALQNYINTGSTNLGVDASNAVILYQTLERLVTLLENVENIAVYTSDMNTNKSTASNQTTNINRLTELLTEVTNLANNIDNIAQSNANIETELVTGDLRTTIESVLLELQEGLIKLNTDNISLKIDAMQQSLSVLENQLYGLHPTHGINASLMALLTDIRNKLIVELVEKPTEVKVVLTNQVLADKPVIRSVPLYTANVEYSIVVPADTRRLSIKSRLDEGNGDANGIIRYAYLPGIVANATPIGEDSYYTVGQYVEDSDENLVLTEPLAIYFAADIPNVVVSVKYWGAPIVQTATPRGTPHIKYITLTFVDTEYVYQIPINAKEFTIKCRDNTNDPTGTIRVAYKTGVVASAVDINGDSYTTIHSGSELVEENLSLSSALNVYLASDVAALPLTVEYWT